MTLTTYLQNTTEKNRLEDNTTWIATTCVTAALIITCVPFLYFLFKHKKGKVNYFIFSFEIRKLKLQVSIKETLQLSLGNNHEKPNLP